MIEKLTLQKNSNEYKYKNKVIMRKDDSDENTKLKCEDKIDNKIVNIKYGMKKNGRIVREYNKDTIEGMQNSKCHDGMNRTNKIYACVV